MTDFGEQLDPFSLKLSLELNVIEANEEGSIRLIELFIKWDQKIFENVTKRYGGQSHRSSLPLLCYGVPSHSPGTT